MPRTHRFLTATRMHPLFQPSYHLALSVPAWAIIALLAGAPYWLGPLTIKFKHSRPASPTPMQLVADTAALPPALVPFVTNARRALSALGFSNFALLRQLTGVVLIAESDSGTVATALALPRKDGQLHSLIGFTTQIAGGAKLRTSNAPLPPILPQRAGESRVRLPHERDTARLHAIHARRVAAATGGGARIDHLSVADPFAYQQREEASGIAHAEESGYWRRSGDKLVLTWKGAFLSAWRMLPPWREMAVRRDERRMRSLSTARG